MLRLRPALLLAAAVLTITPGFAQSAANCKVTYVSQPGNKYGLAPEGINKYDTIVGFSNQNAPTDFIRYNDGTFGKITVPGAADTVAMRRNASGTTVGYYIPTGQANQYYNEHGFMAANGSTTIVNHPNSKMTRPAGINKSGTIVGTWIPSNSSFTQGFLWKNGTFSAVTPINDVYLNAINDAGVMVGSELFKPYLEGVIFTAPNASPKTVNYPNSEDTVLNDINNLGFAVGVYDLTPAPNNPQHGFLFNTKTNQFYSFDVANAVQTFLTGINDANTVVGYAFFKNASGTGTYTRGFYASCTL